MLLIVDNRDSFTWNLVHMFAAVQSPRSERGTTTSQLVVSCDDPQLLQHAASASAIVIGPGPGHPTDATASLAIIRTFQGRTPIWGICLGHQCIAIANGARCERTTPRHGKRSTITHDHSPLFSGMPTTFSAMRYHSLAISATSVQANSRVSATSELGEIMAIDVATNGAPMLGVQFHPESFATEYGLQMARNFLSLATNWQSQCFLG